MVYVFFFGGICGYMHVSVFVRYSGKNKDHTHILIKHAPKDKNT